MGVGSSFEGWLVVRLTSSGPTAPMCLELANLLDDVLDDVFERLESRFMPMNQVATRVYYMLSYRCSSCN